MKWLVFVLALCACPEPGPCPSEFVLGTEEGDNFSALADGASLKINRGPQGGWHVWVSVQATGIPSTGALAYQLRSGGQVVSAPLRINLDTSPVDSITCGWERRSDALVFAGDGEQWRGSSGELELVFGGTTVKRSVRLF